MSLQDYEKHHFGWPKMIKHSSYTHRHECLRSSSPAWRSRSCCAGSCWACWSSPPFLPHCLRPAGRCSYPASSAQKQTAGPCCSAATTQEETGERRKQTNYFKFHIAEENRTTKHRLSVTDIRKFCQAHLFIWNQMTDWKGLVFHIWKSNTQL